MKIDGQNVTLNSFERAGFGWGETNTYPLDRFTGDLMRLASETHQRIECLESEIASIPDPVSPNDLRQRELTKLKFTSRNNIENMAVQLLWHDMESL